MFPSLIISHGWVAAGWGTTQGISTCKVVGTSTMQGTRYSSIAPRLNLVGRVGSRTINKLPSAAHEIVAKESEAAQLRATGTAAAGPVCCVVCAEKIGRYTCPRCFAQYCTVACYQQHGQRCTEAFYQEHVLDELHSRPLTSEAERREMLAILYVSSLRIILVSCSLSPPLRLYLSIRCNGCHCNCRMPAAFT
jgi:hypothetical protein